MKAILKKDNIYVVVDQDCPDEDKVREDAQFICGEDEGTNLFGGRVYVSSCRYLSIDGIEILIPHFINYFHIQSDLSINQCVAYLNQIEQLGVDTFLDNYKKVIKEYKTDVEKQIGDLQNELLLKDDSDKKYKLKNLQEVFSKLSCLLVALYINLNAGIDNFTYIDAYDSIINQFF